MRCKQIALACSFQHYAKLEGQKKRLFLVYILLYMSSSWHFIGYWGVECHMISK
jgi:hypothetical protein